MVAQNRNTNIIIHRITERRDIDQKAIPHMYDSVSEREI